MSADLVTLKRDGNIAVVTLNDPERRNALGMAMFDELENALNSLETDESIRVILLRGAGSVFCAGFDLGSAVEKPELMGRYIDRLSRINRRIRRLGPVVVAAAGGGGKRRGCPQAGAGLFFLNYRGFWTRPRISVHQRRRQ